MTRHTQVSVPFFKNSGGCMNSVFIATSLDGYIADSEGGIGWLNSVPNPEQDDMGYGEFMSRVDALVMGRKTFETVLSFGIDWPYEQPVFVLSEQLESIPEPLKERVFLVKGDLEVVLESIHEQGYHQLYIDGGTTIRNFLKAGLIDELILTTIPILLGGGISLFDELGSKHSLELVKSRVYLNQVVQSQYRLNHPVIFSTISS